MQNKQPFVDAVDATRLTAQAIQGITGYIGHHYACSSGDINYILKVLSIKDNVAAREAGKAIVQNLMSKETADQNNVILKPYWDMSVQDFLSWLKMTPYRPKLITRMSPWLERHESEVCLILVDGSFWRYRPTGRSPIYETSSLGFHDLIHVQRKAYEPGLLRPIYTQYYEYKSRYLYLVQTEKKVDTDDLKEFLRSVGLTFANDDHASRFYDKFEVETSPDLLQMAFGRTIVLVGSGQWVYEYHLGGRRLSDNSHNREIKKGTMILLTDIER